MSGKEVPCLTCGEPFTSRKGGRFCRVCKGDYNRTVRNRKEREADELRERVAANVPAGTALPTQQEFLSAVRTGAVVATTDRQPPAWLAHWGSQDGRSTYFKAVSEAIDQKLRELKDDLEAQQWYEENPHWAVGIPGSEHLVERAPDSVLSCGKRRGTTAGYWRHKRDKTMVCPECTSAYQESEKVRWHTRK